MKPKKYDEIPILQDYSGKFPEEFWKKFPVRSLPSSPESCVNHVKLEELLKARMDNLTKAEFKRGLRAVSFIREGAPSHQKTELPGVFCQNTQSAFLHRESLSDTLADWVVKKFVAGPFSHPPTRKFRVNSIMMVPQKDKIRPVINMSVPKGASFNDNISEFGPEKVVMSSPQSFGYSVLDSGKNSVMSKFDVESANKNIPCQIKDLRLQGFSGGENTL